MDVLILFVDSRVKSSQSIVQKETSRSKSESAKTSLICNQVTPK